ncbi:(Na+)-NQR maturation NqrM [Cobetia sp. D5]|uniref:(Na+)-NQR maturation NqrM n=1 Tax=Cobetia sp. D5 TaxID=3105867 RepID=UPI002D76C618|nr:(Na+)-NQR maturation NqrM [Cobetia sp. D5]
MTIWLLVFAAMLLLIGVMAVGVLMGRKPIAGSCGGLNNLGLKDGCDICGGKDEECEKEQDRQRLMAESGGKLASDLAYDAARR